MPAILSRCIFIALVLCSFAIKVSFAQSHYWTQSYGTKSMLLSNSVIGGVSDLGAVYYNPGRLGLVDNPAFLISADAYEWNQFRIDNAFGDQADLNNSSFGGVPSLTAGTFKVGFLEGHTFAYAVLLRQDLNIDVTYQEEDFGELIEAFPGEEYFRGNVNIFTKSKEEWASFSWSFPWNDRFSVGITTAASILDAGKRNRFELQALTSDEKVSTYQYNRRIGFQRYGVLWKLGLASTYGNFDWGITVTTPSIKVLGDASYNYEEFLSSLEEYMDRPDLYTTDKQSGLALNYRTPWAVGAGLSIPVNRHKIHLSTEWYGGVKEYTMFTVKDHVSQSTGDTIGFTLNDRLNSVLNFGVGTEIYLKDKLSMYFSFSTDFSAAPGEGEGFISQEPVAINSTTTSNFYHFASGFVLTLPGADITLGAAYTGGKQDFPRPIDFPDEEDDGIFDMDEMATMSWNRWRLVLSFSVPFLEQKGQELIDKVDFTKKKDKEEKEKKKDKKKKKDKEDEGGN
jgi:hypothetical protein